MKHLIILMVTLSIFTLFSRSSSLAGASQQVVIVNRNNPTTQLTASDLKRIYNGNIKLWNNGHTVVPVVMSDSDPLSINFIKRVFGVDIDIWRGLWIQKSLSGNAAPPHQEKNCSSVINFIASEPGAIGFIKKENLTGDVKVISIDGKTEF